MKTITVSHALKQVLFDLKVELHAQSLNDVIIHVCTNPATDVRTIHGKDDVLTESVAVSEHTRGLLKHIKEQQHYDDYEAVIRSKAGIAPRVENREAPVEITPLD